MAQFNLNDYETVEVRLQRLYAAHPDARVITKNLTTPADRSTGMWIVQAEIWLPIWDTVNVPVNVIEKWSEISDFWFLKATGLAFEIDGVNGMANKTSALENCETSSIGRALANMNLSGNKRTSREEMAKVERGVTPAKITKSVAWAERIASLADVDSARRLYMEAQKAKADKTVLDEITAKVATFGPAD